MAAVTAAVAAVAAWPWCSHGESSVVPCWWAGGCIEGFMAPPDARACVCVCLRACACACACATCVRALLCVCV